MKTRLTEYADAKELALNLTLRELRGKYKRSALGWAWSMLNPLSMVLIFGVVFRFFLKIEPPIGDPSGLHNFAMFLFCGILAWNYLSNGLTGSMVMLVGNGNLIKKVYFPREILVVANTGSWAYSLLIELGVLSAVLLVFGNFALPWIPVVLLLVLLETMVVLGLGLLLSVLNVYFRDVQHLFGIVMQAWFYATPIVYPISLVKQASDTHPDFLGGHISIYDLYRLNPMVRLVEAFRDVLYDLRFPPIADLLYVFGFGIVALVVGLKVFWRLEGRLAEEL